MFMKDYVIIYAGEDQSENFIGVEFVDHAVGAITMLVDVAKFFAVKSGRNGPLDESLKL